jgi:hypothetical protein
MVADAPSFQDLAPRLLDFIGESDLAGYNSNKFDIPVLSEELLRCGIDFDLGARHFVDVQNIFHKMEQRTLAAAYKFYCGKQIENAHNALYDTLATLEVLQAQTEKYADLDNNIAGLAKFSTVGTQQNADFAGRLSFDDNQEVCYNFGKHKGKTIKEVHIIADAVKDFLIQPPELDNENPGSLILINPKETDRYILEVVNTRVGPWVAYEKLIDIKKNIFYKIEQGTPSPFFVYENKLYIPDRFNIIFVSKRIEEVEFTCYTLK